MPQIITVDKKTPSKPKLSNSFPKEAKTPPLFRKENYIIMILGVVLVAAGYILLAGGGSDSDAVYSDAIFNTRRMIVAPTMILLGLVTGIVAIMWHPKKKAEAAEKEE